MIIKGLVKKKEEKEDTRKRVKHIKECTDMYFIAKVVYGKTKLYQSILWCPNDLILVRSGLFWSCRNETK